MMRTQNTARAAGRNCRERPEGIYDLKIISETGIVYV